MNDTVTSNMFNTLCVCVCACARVRVHSAPLSRGQGLTLCVLLSLLSSPPLPYFLRQDLSLNWPFWQSWLTSKARPFVLPDLQSSLIFPGAQTQTQILFLVQPTFHPPSHLPNLSISQDSWRIKSWEILRGKPVMIYQTPASKPCGLFHHSPWGKRSPARSPVVSSAWPTVGCKPGCFPSDVLLPLFKDYNAESKSQPCSFLSGIYNWTF